MNINSVKARNKMIEEIAFEYNVCLAKMIDNPINCGVLNLNEPMIDYGNKEINVATLSSYETKVIIINLFLGFLYFEEKEIIWRDFFKKDDNKWWEKTYTRSQYYRYKKAGTQKFLQQYLGQQN